MTILGVNVCYGESPVAIGKKIKRCAHCPRNKEQKIANLCHAFVCGIHSSKTTRASDSTSHSILRVLQVCYITLHYITSRECRQCPNQCSDDDVNKNDGYQQLHFYVTYVQNTMQRLKIMFCNNIVTNIPFFGTIM